MAYQPKSYRKFVATAATAAIVASAVAPAASAASNDFTDVPERYKEAVDYLVANGITNGMTPTKFGISEDIKRADAAVMLAKALGVDTLDAPDSGFTDVPERAVKAVNALKAKGFINGKTATKFGSDDPLTRGEVALILTKAYELDGGDAQVDFTDVNDRYLDAVKALVNNKITSGKTSTSFGTADKIIRGDFAVFLFKAEHIGKEEPVVPEVVNVSAINASEVVVTFSKDVDEATALRTANYELKVNDVEATIKDIVVEDNTATLLLDETDADTDYFQSGDKFVLQTNDAIKTADGQEFPKYVSEEQTFEASAAPSLESIDTDAAGLVLEFDRPVAAATGSDVTLIKVDGVSITSKDLLPAGDRDGDDVLDVAKNYKYTVELTTAEKEKFHKVGTHEVVIYDVKETAAAYAKKASVLTGEYTVSDDVATPAVTGIEAINANKFFIYTNKTVDLSNAKLTVEKGTHEFTTANELLENSFLSDDTVVDAVVSDYKGKPGIYVIVSDDVSGDDENPLYKDGESNVDLKVSLENYKSAGLIGSKSVQNVTLSKNDNKPVVEETSIVGNDLVVEFENVLDTDLTADEIVVRDKDGVVIPVTDGDIVTTTDTVTITLSDVEDEPYTVEFKAGKFAYAEVDNSVAGYLVNTLKNDKITVTVESQDQANFKYTEFDLGSNVSIPAGETNVIEIAYGVEMSDSARAVSNYKLDGKALPAGSSVDFYGDKETVRVTLPEGTLVSSTDYKLSISTDVTTAAGSHIVGSLQTKEAAEAIISLTDNVAPELDSALYLVAVEKVTSSTTTNKVELAFNENLAGVANDATSYNDLKVVVNGTVVGVTGVVAGDDANELIITLAQQVNVNQSATISIVPADEQNGDQEIVIDDVAGNDASTEVSASANTSKFSQDLADAAAAAADLQSVADAKTAIDSADYSNLNNTGVTQADYTAAVQAAVTSAVNDNTVTATVTWNSGASTYDVAISKNGASDSTSIDASNVTFVAN